MYSTTFCKERQAIFHGNLKCGLDADCTSRTDGQAEGRKEVVFTEG